MYTPFGTNDIVTRQAQELVTSTWTGNVNNLQTAFTASSQTDLFATPTSSGHFFIEVLDKDPLTDTTAEVQYAVSYGHVDGSGSLDFTNDTGSFGLGASRVIYNQYRQLHFYDDTTNFTFGSHTPKSIYVININRSRYKQRLTLGSLNLHISGNSVGISSESQDKMELTEDSVTNGAFETNTNLGPVYRIVSGTNGVVSGSVTNQLTINGSASNFGNFYPQAGLIILNAEAFNVNDKHEDGDGSAGFLNTQSLHPFTGSHAAVSNLLTGSRSKTGTNLTIQAPGFNTNAQSLYRHISAAGHFIVDTTEEINSQFYFCRIRNDQYNYTNNQSFVDASNNIRFESMKLNPKVFITTVGLYNQAFELLAVAKLSQPIAKDFTKEALIRVKLDF